MEIKIIGTFKFHGANCNTSGYYALAESMGLLTEGVPDAGRAINLFTEILSTSRQRQLLKDTVKWLEKLRDEWSTAKTLPLKKLPSAALTMPACKHIFVSYLFTYFYVLSL
jgi:hypothetical protein